MYICACMQTFQALQAPCHTTPGGLQTRPNSQMWIQTHTSQDTNTQIYLHGWFGECFSFGRIYDGKQQVMKPREIFTVSVRAYYPGEENGVNWKYLLKTGCCLLSERGPAVFRLCHHCSEPSNSEVSVKGSNFKREGINGQFTANSWHSDYFMSYPRYTV